MHKAYKEVPKDYNFEEMCPHCGEYIPIVIDDDDTTNYEIICPVCGEKMMLCTLCHWDQQDEEDYCGDRCDWSPAHGCFRNRK